MKFRAIHVNQEKYYSIGIDEDTQQFVLAVVITWIGWYSRYFALTREEFDSFASRREYLNELADSCASGPGIHNNRERFICSEKTEENVI
jgi:hypothetical protein